MKHLLLLSYISILLLILNESFLVHCECNACSAHTNVACISDTEFQQCKDNKPFGIIYKCNEGYYCSIYGTCIESEELSDCKLCKQCIENKIFACIDTQTFALCVNGEISDKHYQCNGNDKCDINNPNICGNNNPTCSFRDDPTQATTTTTPSPAVDPNGFCQFKKQKGRFAVGTNPQSTCRQYISCDKIGNTWYGPIYNCPGHTYFDETKNGCVVNKPSICKGTVTRLDFQNMLLE